MVIQTNKGNLNFSHFLSFVYLSKNAGNYKLTNKYMTKKLREIVKKCRKFQIDRLTKDQKSAGNSNYPYFVS